jgi:hypothetical protein
MAGNFYFCLCITMKIKYILLLLAGLMTAMIVNSCKKQNQTTIQTLFTGGAWQLSSVQAIYFTGNKIDSSVTLNSTCNLTQFFTFNSNNTCTYTNFDCIQQSSPSAQWSLSSDQLTLFANVVLKDTTAAGSSMPFANAQIMNLGQFSLVLLTGDLQTNYSLTKKRKQVQYGFVHVKAQ